MADMFIYTVSNKALTSSQRIFYEENGYIYFKNLINHEDLDKYKQRFIDICNGIVDSSAITVVKDYSLLKQKIFKGERLLYKIQDFLYDSVLFDYARDKRIVNVVSSIIGDGITGFNSMFINKPPNSLTNSHPLHQDLHFFPFRPENKICGSWTAVEKMTEENGCLMVIPGSHKSSLLLHGYPNLLNNSIYHGIMDTNHFKPVQLPMEKGDTIFFHPLLIHGSGPNLTQGFRKCISVHYLNNNCNFINMRDTEQEFVVDEVEKIFVLKGFSVDYNQSWIAKSRRITGKPGKYHELTSRL
nr:phytanoyl-CoA dioxygenase, peroxisomal-like [Onthophagus taurus]